MIPSFCRVTGNSRNLPKPNYFPLLPPISPAEARRICKLTGKSQSWEDHHYVPVIEFGKENRTLHCHITQNSEGNEFHNYVPTDDCWQRTPKSDARGEVGCRITSKYQVNSEYVYVFPVLEPPSSTSSKIAHQEWKELEKVLNKNITLTKNTTTPDFPDQQTRYVYALSDENISLVLPAALEDAVRQGDIESLLMSKAGDRSLLRLRNGKTVSLPLRQLSHEEVTAEEPFLYQGGGQESHVLKKQKKIKAYKKRKMSDSLVGCRRRFLDIRNNEEISNSSLKKVEEETDAEQRLAQVNWSARVAELDAGYRSAANQLVFGPDWRDLVYPNPEKWDWDAFPQLGEEDSIPLPETLPSIEPLRVDINELSPGPFQGPPLVSNDTVGFEAVPVFEPIPAPLQPEVDPTLVQALQQMSSTLTQIDDIKTLFKNVESAMLLPFIHEVEDIAKNLSNGTPGALVEDLCRGDVQFLPQEAIKRDEPENINIVEGLLVTLGGEERFVMGRQVEQMNRAKSFVAGRTALNHANKHEFQPGIVVQTPEAPGFISGLVFLSPGQGETFYPGEILTDAEGHSKFHPGQALQTLHGPKFTTGFAIPTPEGPKFIAGHVHQDKLLPGQLLKTQEGTEYISGQTYDSPKGVCFLPGRVVSKSTGRDFIPGQDVKNADGDVQFAPGYSLETPEGPVFMPGIAIPAPADPQKMKFVAGIVQEGSFIPGLLTEKTGQFVVGKMAQNPDGSGSGFVPGKIDSGSKTFEASTKLDEVQVLEFKNCPSQHWNTWPVSGSSLTAMPFSKPEMGYMKQDAQAIKFYRTETNPEIAEGECKIVSGQLWNVEWEETPRFIPGKLIETAIGTRFVSGQLVRTQRGEQFTPGVVIDSRDNPPKYPPKFVPGQLIETKDGKRFCPGQVLPPTGKKGGPPRFVVGNILQTTYGATFVPSQVMYTDQGSRLVPGNIHMTTQGPRFVPAVLEDVGNGVKFREGVVVETPEGPRYLAPDLEENEEGALEFTVQSFEVTPEELRLITAYPFAALHFPLTDDEPLIDARMLRQMAAAGAAVERYTAQHLHDVKISCPQDTNTAILGANAFNVQEPDLESLVTRPTKTSQKKAATTGMQSEGTYRPSQQDTNTTKESGSGVHSTTNEDSSLSQTGLNSSTGSESVQKGLSDKQLSDSEAGGETDDCQAVSVDPVEELTSSGTEQTNELSEKTNKLLDLSVDEHGTSVSQNQLGLLADKDETDLGNKTQSTTCSTENQNSVKGSHAYHTSKTNLTDNHTSVTNGDSQIASQDNDGIQASQFPQDIDSIDGNAPFASAAGRNNLDRIRNTNEQETSRKSSMTSLHDQKALTKTDGEVGNATYNFGTNEASSANNTIPLTRCVSLSTISNKDSENAPSACGLPNDSQTMNTNEINAEDPRNATEFISGKEKNREEFNEMNSKSLTSSVEEKGKNSLENSKAFISEEGTCQGKGLHGNSVLQQGHGQTAGDCEPCHNLDLANSPTLELSSTEPAHDKYDGPSPHNSQDVSDPGCYDGDVRGTTRKEGPCQDISRLGAEERKANLLIGDIGGRVLSPTTHQGISLTNLKTSPSTTKSSLLPEDQLPSSSNTSPQQTISVTPTLSECPVAGKQTSQVSDISKRTDKISQESNNLAAGHGPLAEHSHGLTNAASSSEALRRLTTPPNSTGLSQSSNSCKNSEKTALTTPEQSKSNTLQAVNSDGQATHNLATLAVGEHAKHLGERHATSDDGFHTTAKENSVGIGSMPNTTGSSDSVPLQHPEDKSAPVTQSDAPNSFTPAGLTAPSRSESTANSSTVLLDSTLTSTKANNEKTGENNELVEQDKDLAKIIALERNKNSSPPCTQSSAGNLTSERLDNQSLGDTAELFTSGDQLGTKIQLDRGMLENVDNSLSATGNGLTGPVNHGDLAGARHVDGTMLDKNHSDSITALLGVPAIESKINSRHGHVANEDVNTNGPRKDEGSQVSSNRGGDDFQHGMPGIDNGLAVATDAERSQTLQAAGKVAGSLHKGYQDAEQVPMNGSSGTIEGQFRRSEPGTRNHSQGTKGGRHTLLDSAGADTPKSSESLSVDANDGNELDISSKLLGPRELDEGSRSKTCKAAENLVPPNSEASNKDVSTLGTKGVRQGNRKTSHDKGDLVEGEDSEGMKLSTAIDLANANLKSQTKGVSRNRQAEESNIKNRDSNVKYLNDSRDDAETKVFSPSSLTATSLSASTSRKDSQEIREKKAHLHFLSELLDKDASEDVNEESGYGDSMSSSKQTDTHSFVKDSQDRIPGTVGLNDSLMSSSTDHASLAVQAFFKRIKSDLDCVEEDPFIRGTLKQAEGLALVIGRPDLAQNVRQLLDILKNSQGDEEMVHLIANILSLKEMAEDNPELEELLQKVENKPELIAQDKNLKENLAQAIAHIEKDTTVGETAGGKEPSQQSTSDRNLDSQERKTTTQVPGLGHLDNDKVYENVSLDSSSATGLQRTDLDKAQSSVKYDDLCRAPRASTVDCNSTQNAENNANNQSNAGFRNANTSPKFLSHNDSTGVDINRTELGRMPQGQGSIRPQGQEVSNFGQATSEGKQSLLRSLGNAEIGKYAENIGKLNDGISDTNQSQLAANGAPATKDTSTGQKELIPQELNDRNRNTDSNAQYCSANGENHSANANSTLGEFLSGQTENFSSRKNEFDGAATKLRQSTADQEKTLVGGDIALESQIKAKDSDTSYVPVKSILSRKSSNPNQHTNADILAGDSSESTSEGHESKSFLNRTDKRGLSSATPLDVPDEDSEISETPIMRRPPRTPKRISVTSRPSSLRYSSGDLLSDSQNAEEDEEKTSSRTSATHSRKTSFKQKFSSSTDPNNTTTLSVGETVFPNIISSSKDIPQEIIDTLRYSTDEAKKELYVEQILDALARTQAEHLQSSEENEVNDEEDEFDEQSSQKRRARFTPRRKSSACVILKDFLETIVPRDAARGVLIGDIDYMVIDEDGVRYFESASEFASRRSSRFDLRLSRAGSSDSTSGPWPWADTAPSSASRSRRCSVDEHMRRARLSRSDLKAHKSQPATRQSSAERLNARRGRFSMPISRSPSSSAITSLSAMSSRRSSVSLTDDQQRRKRKVGAIGLGTGIRLMK